MKEQKDASLDRRCRKTKQAIKEALIMLLRSKKLSEISISELAELADVNRKTFYNHYPDLQAVLEDVETDAADRMFAIISPDVWKDLHNPHQFFLRLNAEIRKNPNFYQALIEAGEDTRLAHMLKSKLNDYLGEDFKEEAPTAVWESTLLTYLTSLQNDVPGFNRKMFLYYVDFILAGMLSVYQRWFSSPDTVSLEELSQLICQMIPGGTPLIEGK